MMMMIKQSAHKWRWR